uniref:Oxygen sensor histidine kinase NreB n=1 Tax=Solibacter usitatus (strain Ellin6076) TaxID=234267 RepID=Q01SI4_SOLUE
MSATAHPRDTVIAMLPRQITHQNIFRVLIAGFSLVTLLLAAAAIVSLRNIQSIQQNADSLVREQSLSNRLIDELHSQQTTLSEVFSVLARDPDSVDYYKIMSQLDEADRDIARISAEGARTAEHDLWQRLNLSSLDFSREARRILAAEAPETFSSIDLFRFHGAFASVVARLLEAEYRKLSVAQAQIEHRTSHLSEISLVFAAASVVLALIFAVFTVRLVSQLIRQMESQTAELGRVSWHMLEDQEATARRFSHELHDELGQSLTAVKTNLTALAGTTEPQAPRLADCVHLVDEAIGNVRQMSQLLRPTILDDFGLEAGLRWLADGFSARTGIEVHVESTYSGRLPDDTETHLFRISQEALTNIARHAAARHVTVKLDRKPAEICLSISDDGRGIAAAPQNGRGLGMIGMRARARSAGGDVNVRSRPGEGVLIEVRVPLKHEENPHPAV